MLTILAVTWYQKMFMALDAVGTCLGLYFTQVVSSSPSPLPVFVCLPLTILDVLGRDRGCLPLWPRVWRNCYVERFKGTRNSCTFGKHEKVVRPTIIFGVAYTCCLCMCVFVFIFCQWTTDVGRLACLRSRAARIEAASEPNRHCML